MLRSHACWFTTLALTTLVAGCARPSVGRGFVPGAQLVNIVVLCPAADRVSIRVTPPSVHVYRARDSVTWAIRGNGTQATITPKTVGHWPFAGSPYVATPGSPANSGTTVRGASLGAYAYNVEVVCRVPNSDAVITVTLDPDVIIIED